MLGKKIIAATIGDEACFIRSLNAGKSAVTVIELLQRVGNEPALFLELGAILVCLCHCDAQGARTYQDAQLDEIKEEASFAYLQEFTQKALEISGLGEDAEAVRKNSSIAP